jgi:hypothetical protein
MARVNIWRRSEFKTARLLELPTSNGWNNGPPVIGPVFDAVTAPVAMATGWGQPNPGCFLDRDFNGGYTAMCGLQDRSGLL